MRLRWKASLLLASIGCGAYAQGPASTLYITADSGADLILVSGSSQTFLSTVFGEEGPLAVDGMIATTGTSPGGYGASYGLDGTFTGSVYASSLANSALDGTTDGVSNYEIDSLGDVYSTDLSYELPSYLFSAGSQATGISYDPSNASLWIDSNGLIGDYTLGGTMVRAFATGLTGYSALAFDRADGTLWIGTDLTGAGAILSQYAVDGTFLQDETLPVTDIEGMEFNEAAPPTPEPSSFAAFGLGLGILSFSRVRRFRNSKRPNRSAGRRK